MQFLGLSCIDQDLFHWLHNEISTFPSSAGDIFSPLKEFSYQKTGEWKDKYALYLGYSAEIPLCKVLCASSTGRKMYMENIFCDGSDVELLCLIPV